MMTMAGSAKCVVSESDDDDADKGLFLDWRGSGAAAGAVSDAMGLVQQRLGFKQVKLRSADAVKVMVPNEQVRVRVREVDEKRKAEVTRSCENVVVVSLSDDEDPRPIGARRKGVFGQACGSGVVCLDSDSDSELSPSTRLKSRAPAKVENVEKAAVRRSWENWEAGFVGAGPSKQYEVALPNTSGNDRDAGKIMHPANLEKGTCEKSESNKHDKCPSPPTNGKLVGSRSSELVVIPRATGSSSRDDRTEFEFRSSEERVNNFKRILEGRVEPDNSSAKPARRRGDSAERAAMLSVFDYKDETVSASRDVLGRSSLNPESVLKERSENVLVPPLVTATKSSLSRVRKSHEKLNLPSHVIIQDLSSSDDDEESKKPCTSGIRDKDGRKIHDRISGGIESDGLEFGPTGKISCPQSQGLLKSEKASRAATIDIEDLSADEGPDLYRPLARGDKGPSNRDEPPNSMKISITSRTSDGVAPEIPNSTVPLLELSVRNEESTSMQLQLKRKCVRSAEDPYPEERLTSEDWMTNDDVDLRFQIRNIGIEGSRRKRRPSSDKDLSPFEAAKVAVEMEKLEKQKEREREKEARNALKEEEKKRRKEEILKKREELKQQKEAAKAEAAERKKIEQECIKWKKGKFALEHTTIYIDKTIIESKILGPPLLQQLASKEYTYQIVTNPIEKTIRWTMKMPPEDSQAILDALGSQDETLSNSQLPLEEVEIKYVVVFLDAAEFTDMVEENSVNDKISRVKKEHPGYTICFLLNNLTRYMYKIEQNHYRAGDKNWMRPNVEQVLTEFITHHTGILSRICVDENEMAEHIVGLTRGLAECPFKPKLTTLTINANGEHIGKKDPNRDVIKRDPWKRALAAIPNMTGAAVIAIVKVYPTMRVLLNAYLDPAKTVLEKEFLLQDIVKDTALGSARSEGRRVGPVCSKRIYRLLMAQNGNLRTEAAEDGEDYFRESQ